MQTCLCLTDLSTGESYRGFRPCLIFLTGGCGNEGVACSGLLKAGLGSARVPFRLISLFSCYIVTPEEHLPSCHFELCMPQHGFGMLIGRPSLTAFLLACAIQQAA
jgi:hypothetical protein